MNKEIIGLKPKNVWKNFYQLTQIPRPSYSEEKIRIFMKRFGEKLGLKTIVDEVGNVIIQKAATRGYEHKKRVILQGHLDMVPQKNRDTPHDFKTDPIDMYIDGEWVTARDTTLGADNGIGVAAIMSLLEASDIEHPPLEALFTASEEVGMNGVSGLKTDVLKGEILLNLDSEDEGELFVGCAGGRNATVTFSYILCDIPENFISYKLSLKGLKGGHSGIDIILGRGNANKLLNRFLKYTCEKLGGRIANIEGGNLRNAIPRESFSEIVIHQEKEKDFLTYVQQYETICKEEYKGIEDTIVFSAEKTKMAENIMDVKTQERFIDFLYVCPNGVIRMSKDMEGLVDTSNNIATVKVLNGKANIKCLLRSSVATSIEDLSQMIRSAAALSNAKIAFDGDYPGWKPNLHSPVLELGKKVYKDLFDITPELKGIHAGLECGYILAKYPKLDIISFGPTIRYPHSPDEKVELKSVERFWQFLVKLLKQL